MKKGYMAELQSREMEFQEAKAELETLYVRKEAEDEINGNAKLKQCFESAILKVEGLTTTYAGTVKSVKLAVETWHYVLFDSWAIHVHTLVYFWSFGLMRVLDTCRY